MMNLKFIRGFFLIANYFQIFYLQYYLIYFFQKIIQIFHLYFFMIFFFNLILIFIQFTPTVLSITLHLKINYIILRVEALFYALSILSFNFPVFSFIQSIFSFLPSPITGAFLEYSTLFLALKISRLKYTFQLYF